ncbi:hypothetical protein YASMINEVIRUS_221 [Yasminevirus sp. GU-2018]|uniref:Uncharacterized protein n=1 Tax=Yasminevirus sp. GU-2018 TaxID=2420051 RepID=A0A5K0U770_9VIRU|nr:hypothetical protein YASMINEVIRUS_221 [Yasminevirus sp. GU-2018]
MSGENDYQSFYGDVIIPESGPATWNVKTAVASNSGLNKVTFTLVKAVKVNDFTIFQQDVMAVSVNPPFAVENTKLTASAEFQIAEQGIYKFRINHEYVTGPVGDPPTSASAIDIHLTAPFIVSKYPLRTYNVVGKPADNSGPATNTFYLGLSADFIKLITVDAPGVFNGSDTEFTFTVTNDAKDDFVKITGADYDYNSEIPVTFVRTDVGTQQNPVTYNLDFKLYYKTPNDPNEFRYINTAVVSSNDAVYPPTTYQFDFYHQGTKITNIDEKDPNLPALLKCFCGSGSCDSVEIQATDNTLYPPNTAVMVQFEWHPMRAPTDPEDVIDYGGLHVDNPTNLSIRPWMVKMNVGGVEVATRYLKIVKIYNLFTVSATPASDYLITRASSPNTIVTPTTQPTFGTTLTISIDNECNANTQDTTYDYYLIQGSSSMEMTGNPGIYVNNSSRTYTYSSLPSGTYYANIVDRKNNNTENRTIVIEDFVVPETNFTIDVNPVDTTKYTKTFVTDPSDQSEDIFIEDKYLVDTDRVPVKIVLTDADPTHTYTYCVLHNAQRLVTGTIKATEMDYDLPYGVYTIQVIDDDIEDPTKNKATRDVTVKRKVFTASVSSDWYEVLDGEEYGTENNPVIVRKCCYDGLITTVLNLNASNANIPLTTDVQWTINKTTDTSYINTYNNKAIFTVSDNSIVPGKYKITVEGSVNGEPFKQVRWISVVYDQDSIELFSIIYNNTTVQSGDTITIPVCDPKTVGIKLTTCERNHVGSGTIYTYKWTNTTTTTTGEIPDSNTTVSTNLALGQWKITVTATPNQPAIGPVVTQEKTIVINDAVMFDLFFYNSVTSNLMGQNLASYTSTFEEGGVVDIEAVLTNGYIDDCGVTPYKFVLEKKATNSSTYFVFRDYINATVKSFSIENLAVGVYRLRVSDNNSSEQIRSFEIMSTEPPKSLENVSITLTRSVNDPPTLTLDRIARGPTANKPRDVFSRETDPTKELLLDLDFVLLSGLSSTIPVSVNTFLRCCGEKFSCVFDVNAFANTFFNGTPGILVTLKVNNQTTGFYGTGSGVTSTVDPNLITIDKCPAGAYRVELDVTFPDTQTGVYVAYMTVHEPSLCSVSINPPIQYLSHNGASNGSLEVIFDKPATNWCGTNTPTYLYRWQRFNCDTDKYVDINPQTGSDLAFGEPIEYCADFAANLKAGRYRVIVNQVCIPLDYDCSNLPDELVASCDVVAEATICEPYVLQARLCPGAILDLNCHNDKSGAVRLWVTGGTMPYWYQLYVVDPCVQTRPDQNQEVSACGDGDLRGYVVCGDLNTDDTRCGLKAGRYIFKVTDANGCSAGVYFEIRQPPQLTVTVTTDPKLKCGNLVAHAVGGTPFADDGFSICCKDQNSSQQNILPRPENYIYRWVNKADQSGKVISEKHYIEGVETGEYEVTVSDSRCCKVTKSTFLVVDKTCDTSCKPDDDECDDSECNTTCRPKIPAIPFNPVKNDNYTKCRDFKVKVVKITVSASKFGIDVVTTGGRPSYTYVINNKTIPDPSRVAFPFGRQYKLKVTDGDGCIAETVF